MKIVSQTPHQLKMKSDHSFWAVAGTLLGFMFCSAGVAAMLLFSQLTVLRCQRLEPTQIECQLTTTGLLGSQSTRVTNLERAAVATHTNEDSNTYSLVLFAAGQDIPFSQIRSSNYTAKKVNADRINAFINNPRQSALSVQEDNRWYGYFFSGIFIITGGAIVFASWWSKLIFDVVFDKNLGLLTITRQSARGQSHTQSWALEEIEKMLVEETKDNDGDYSYWLFLKLKTGKQLSLSRFSLSSKAQAEAIAMQVCHFLGLTEPILLKSNRINNLKTMMLGWLKKRD